MKHINNFLHHLTFRRKLFLYSLFLSLAPVLILGIVSSYIAASSIQNEVNKYNAYILKQLEVKVDQFLQNIDNTALQLANDQYVQNSMQTGVSMANLQSSLYMIDTVFKAINENDNPIDITLYYTNFDMMYSSRYGIVHEHSAAFDNMVSQAKANYSDVTIISPARNSKVHDLSFVRTIPLNSRNPSGYLIIQLDISELKAFTDQLLLDGHRKILIVNQNGDLLTGVDFADQGVRLDEQSPLFPYWAKPSMQGSVRLNGISYRVSSIQSTFNHWAYIALTPLDDLNRQALNIRAITLGIVIGLSLIWLALAVFGTRRMYVPIQKLVGRLSPEDRKERDGLQAIDSHLSRMAIVQETLQARLDSQQNEIKENVLLRILRGEASKAEMEAFGGENNFDLREDWFIVCAVDIDPYGDLPLMREERDRRLIMYALRNIVEELSQPLSTFATATPKVGQIALVVCCKEIGSQLEQVYRIGQELRFNVKKFFSFTVSVAISGIRPGYEQIYKSYHEVLELLEHRWVTGPNTNITPADLKPSLMQSSHVLVGWKSSVIDCIKRGEYDEASQQLANMIDAVPRSLQHSKSLLGLFAFLIGEMDAYLKELGVELNDIFEYDILEHLFELSSLKEVHNWMANTVLVTVRDNLQFHSLSKSKKIVPLALQYIEQNFETDLSLQKLSDQFAVSPSILSRMFKEEVGTNYIDYVIQFRMEKAKEWLLHTHLPIKEIAERLRYTTVQNFTRIFKQVTGVPPGNYRKKNM